jgi:hypothetical protein
MAAESARFSAILGGKLQVCLTPVWDIDFHINFDVEHDDSSSN